MAVSPDKKDLAVVPLLGGIKIIDAITGNVKGEVEGTLFETGPNHIWSVRYSAKTANLLIHFKRNDGGEELVEWDVSQSKRVRSVKGIKIHSIGSGEKYVLTETENGQLRLFDFAKGTQVRTFSLDQLLQPRPTGVALAPDDEHMIAYNDAGKVVKINLATAKVVHEFVPPGDPGSIKILKFSDNGKYFFTHHDYQKPGAKTHVWDYVKKTHVSEFGGITLLPMREHEYHVDWGGEGDNLVFVTNDKVEDHPTEDEVGVSVGSFNILTKRYKRFTFPYWENQSILFVNKVLPLNGEKLLALTSSFYDKIQQVDLTAKSRTELVSKTDNLVVRAGAFTSDAGKLFHANIMGEIFQWDLLRGAYVGKFARLDLDIDEIKCSTDNSQLIVTGSRNILSDSSSKIVYTFDIRSGNKISEKKMGAGDVGMRRQSNFVPSSDGRLVFTGVFGPAMIQKDKLSIGVAVLRGSEKDFVVFTEDGRFDGTEEGIKQLLYGVEDGKHVNIEKYRTRYHSPGLLQQFVFPELKKAVSMAPVISVKEGQASMLEVTLKNNQSGGIGSVEVYLDNRMIYEDARRLVAENPRSLAENASIAFSLDLKKLSADPQKDISLRIVSFDKNQNISSEYKKIIKRTTPEPRRASAANLGEAAGVSRQPPNFWVLVVGVSTYDYPELNLRFSAKDAEAMSTALQLGGATLFQSQRTHVVKLTSECPPDQQPTQRNIRRALKFIKDRASYDDVVLVYLSGHGVAHEGSDDDFYFLTSNARTANFESSEVRESQSLSGRELREFLNDVKAQKQVLIIDACASGTLANQLLTGRDLSEAVRRGIERMRNRTATYVLAGNAGDRKSYESSAYGQGLLTHTLLQGIKGAALREGRYVDIDNLFQYARDRVELLSRDVNLLQIPVIVAPTGSESFDIGLLPTSELRGLIPVSEVKPVFKKTNLMQSEAFVDILDLSKDVDEKLFVLSYQDNAQLMFAETDYPGAYHIAGEYSKAENTITLKGRILRDKTPISKLSFTGTRDELTNYLLQQIEKNVK